MKAKTMINYIGKLLILMAFLVFLSGASIIGEELIWSSGAWDFIAGFIFCRFYDFIFNN